MKKLIIIIPLLLLLAFGIYSYITSNQENTYNLIQKYEISDQNYNIIEKQVKNSISKSYDLKNTSIRWIRKDKKDNIYRIYTSNLTKYNVINNVPINNIILTVSPDWQINKQEKELEYLENQKSIYKIMVD